MTLYGPFTATAGQVLKCTVSTDPVRLRFVNTSRFDLAVAFTQAQPPAYSSGRPEYLYTVPSGDRVTFDIPFDKYGSFGFPGYVYVFPIDNTTSLAQTGTVSANVAFSIDTYTAGQSAPSDYASPQRYDASSQQRIIALPSALYLDVNNWITGSFAIPAAGTGVNMATPFSLVGLVAINAITWFYFYQALFSLGVNGAGAGGIDFAIQADIQTAGNASIGGTWPRDLIRFELNWPAAAGPYQNLIWTPPQPIVTTLTLTPGLSIDHLSIVFHNYASTNAPTAARFSVGGGLDNFNYNQQGAGAPPLPIGNPNTEAGFLF